MVIKHWNSHSERIIKSIVALCVAVKMYVMYSSSVSQQRLNLPLPSLSKAVTVSAQQLQLKAKSFAKEDEREESLTLSALFPQMVLHGSQQFKSARLWMRTCPRAYQVAHAFPVCTCIGLKTVLPKQRHRVRSSAKLRVGFSYSGRNVMHCTTLL